MSKRKASAPDSDVHMSDDDSDTKSLVNIDFEFFDPSPDTDFHGLRTLLRQLLDPDSNLHDLSALADLILSQPTIGSTVKVDGKETDPYALLTVLNLKVHRDHPGVKTLLDYLLAQLGREGASAGDFLARLKAELENKTVGLVVSERLLNLPGEMAPPMYKMLVEELEWAVSDGEPYAFDSYLVISKTYTETGSALDADDDEDQAATKKWKYGAKGKAKKKKGPEPSAQTFYFHVEDEILVSEGQSAAFGYRDEVEGKADSKRVFGEFGIVPRGLCVLIDKEGMGRAIERMQGLYGQKE